MLDARSVVTLSLCTILAAIPAGTLPAEKVKAWRSTITLPTYPWRDSPHPDFQELSGRIIYPYTMQDDLLKTPADRTYKALFLENEYLKVTCLPELGGRIHSVLDKTRGAEMFHTNDAIKPALIAMRGAWISGGIEWNTGPQGHTVTAVSPVDCVLVENDDGSASLVAGNTEKIFRSRWTVRLTLHPGKACLDETIRIFNPTDGAHPYYFWNCTAFPCRPGTRFIFPMTLGTDHNGTRFFSWPRHEGKDLTYLRNYRTMSSIFAYRCDFDFFGAYDTDSDQGIVGYANHHELGGKKAWTWGQDDFGIVSQMSLSDGGAREAPYIEVQSGPLLTQAEFGMLRPRQQAAWQEWWYPVHGLGVGFEYATRDVAIETIRSDARLELRTIATAVFPGARVTLSQGGRRLLERQVDLSPAAARSIRTETPVAGPVDVTIRTRDGRVLAAYTSPLEVAPVEAPNLTEKRARADGRKTVDELWHEGFLRDRQTRPAEARAKYEEALKEDPQHGPSLRSLAVLDLEAGLWDGAARRLEQALRRDPDDGAAWYLLGVAHLRRGRPADATSCGYRAAFTGDAVGTGYDLVGRAALRLGRHAEALRAFDKALAHSPLDTRCRDHRLLALWAAGDRETAFAAAHRLAAGEDSTAMVPRALLALAGEAGMRRFLRDLREVVGEPVFTLLEVAAVFSEVGLLAEARRLLDASARIEAETFGADPLVHYHLAWLAAQGGDERGARVHVEKAASLPAVRELPSRPEEVDVLRHALRSRPEDARAHLLLGHLLAGLHRLEEALPYWREAVQKDPSLASAWRSLGLHAWKKKDDLGQAEEAYRRAVAARPDDQLLHYELVQVLTARGQRVSGIDIVRPFVAKGHLRADLLLWLAQAYVDEKRHGDAIDLLEDARFSSWEGGTRPHDIFARAHMRGKIRFEENAHAAALEDFSAALTYPENLEVGRPYNAREAEAWYWKGRALEALGRRGEAREAWRQGAGGHEGPARQNEYLQLCAEKAGLGGRGDDRRRL